MSSRLHDLLKTEPARLWGITVVWGLVTVIGWDLSNGDMALARLMGDSRGFFLADNAFLSVWMHTGARNAALVIAVLLIVTAIRPWGIFRNIPRRDLIWAVLTSLLCALLISTLKYFSQTSCPWDLIPFGGKVAYVSHWAHLSDGGPGKCFPAGHASSAFAYFPYYFLFASSERTRRIARLWLASVLVLGALLGLSQQLRGAHFTSHTLWTAWICWAVSGASWWVYSCLETTGRNKLARSWAL